MRTLPTLVTVIVAAAAAAGMAPPAATSSATAGAAPKAATYDVTADTIEGCSCPLFCTCYFGASTPEQRLAIERVLGTVFNVTWKKMEKREDSIEWHDEPAKAYARLASGLSEISLDKNATLRPDAALPTVIKNLQYWFSTSNEGFVLAPSTHKYNGTPSFVNEHKNGFTIAWTAKGDIKPAAGSAGR